MNRSHCPGCCSTSLGDELLLESQPVILNYRFGNAKEAQSVPRRDLCLRECRQCGLIFNASTDKALVPYDERYENRQNFSPAFVTLLEETADALGERYPLAGGTILEVGCGKGDFLRLICARSHAKGLGFDTSYEADDKDHGGEESSNVRFFRRYLGADQVPGRADLVVCRHVVEHVPEIGDFLRLLRDVSIAAGNAPLYVETPAWEWIVDNQAFWDVFHEHCNYFATSTLRRLAVAADFSVLGQRLIFGGQYQALELRHGQAGQGDSASAPIPSLAHFAKTYEESRRRLQARLREQGADAGWAVWGAGAKGVCLANTLKEMRPTFVIDSNPAKNGMFVPGTSIPIVAPSDDRVRSVPLILIANSVYYAEIEQYLACRDLHPELLTL